jgi:hypothetical protein
MRTKLNQEMICLHMIGIKWAQSSLRFLCGAPYFTYNIRQRRELWTGLGIKGSYMHLGHSDNILDLIRGSNQSLSLPNPLHPQGLQADETDDIIEFDHSTSLRSAEALVPQRLEGAHTIDTLPPAVTHTQDMRPEDSRNYVIRKLTQQSSVELRE